MDNNDSGIKRFRQLEFDQAAGEQHHLVAEPANEQAIASGN